VTYALALLAALLLGAGYVLGSRRARNAEGTLKAALDERTEKLTLVEHELQRHTETDPATGLHTQQYFQEFLENEWRRASRQRHSVAVIMVEVDHFRGLNDRMGKSEGNASLKLVADAMKPIIHRPSDVIARYGGAGKFGIVLGSTDSRGAMTIAERLRSAVESLRQPNPGAPTISFLTVSLGVAAATPDREGAWQDIELIASAERALASAREAGRNTVVLDIPGISLSS
jgi:diguanylate cyclase (GGDEF)-like protein